MMEDFNAYEEIVKALKKEREKMGHVNIVIAGKTGVGKSTMINTVFGKNLAETGIGNPVTKHIKKFELPNFPLRLYDTKGLELSPEGFKESCDEILNEIKKQQQNCVADELIHSIWYCVNAASNRFEEAEKDFVKLLADKSGVPVTAILTQSFSKAKANELREHIEQEIPNCKVFCVLAVDYRIDDEYTVKSYGLDKLVDYTVNTIPDSAKKAFITAQKVDIDKKRLAAQAIVAAEVAANFAVGFTPLPFSDAVALMPLEIGMIVGISMVYNVDIEKNTIAAILTSILGTTGATLGGKAIVSGLLKLFPGVGTAIGGIISGGTAAVLTTALGETYILIMEMIYKGEISQQELENAENMEKFKKIFKEKLNEVSKNPIPFIKGNNNQA